MAILECRALSKRFGKVQALDSVSLKIEPGRVIAANAGVEGSVIVEKIKRTKKPGYGYDALNDKYVDMVEAGIIDPTKVTRSALQNAASVAATVLTTESLVADIPEKNPAPVPAADPGMGGMY